MDTDQKPDLHHGSDAKLLFEEETRLIIGLAFSVLNEIGHGLHEKIYENSLVVGFR